MRSAVVFLWLLLSPWQTWAIQSGFFSRVLVSKAQVMTSRTLGFHDVPSGSLQTYSCCGLCLADSSCNLWCRDTSGGQCLFSDMLVMPDYQEANMSDALTCYTTRPKDFATGAAIRGTVSTSLFPTRVIENLVDGIYDQSSPDMCYGTSIDEVFHWFSLDFGKPVTFRTVRMFGTPVGEKHIVAMLTDMEVRVSMNPFNMPYDFNSYDYFGRFIGPATVHNQEITMEATAPVTAQYLAVMKTFPPIRFLVCHFEVY